MEGEPAPESGHRQSGMEPSTEEDHLGDGPAQAVLSANRMSRMARKAEQTKEELLRIQRRVDQMVQAFERSNLAEVGPHRAMEVVEDVEQLESILRDHVLKKKYQQQLTVFIVGYQETCGQRKYLLSQLQEFFSFYAKLADEDTSIVTEELHPELDDVADEVKAALSSSEMAMTRLADLNKQIVDYVNKSRPATVIPKSKKSADDKSRKKLEKSMEQARDDIMRLTNKLLQAQEDVQSKDTRLKELLKQNELKGLECQQFRAQLESTKINLECFQEDYMKEKALLEAEVRRQVASVTQLEEQLRAKMELRRETASQWSDRATSSMSASEWDIELDKELEIRDDLDGTEFSDTLKSSTIFVSPTPSPFSSFSAPPRTSRSGANSPDEGSQVLEEISIQGKSSQVTPPDKEVLEQELLEHPQYDREETANPRSPGEFGDSNYTEQITISGKRTPLPDIQNSDLYGISTQDISDKLAGELDKVNKQHEETTAKLKARFQELNAQWEEERRTLLLQIQQATKDQAVSERKAAFALNELQRLTSERQQMSPAPDVSIKRSSTSQSQSNGQPSRSGSPMSPQQRPGSGQAPGAGTRRAEAAFDDGIHRLHHGIRTLVESVRKGLLAQGLHSFAQLLDGGWILDKDGGMNVPGEAHKAEVAKSLELLQNAAEVFHGLLETISYHSGVPSMQEEVTTEKNGSEEEEVKEEDEEISEIGSVASEKTSTSGRGSKLSILTAPVLDIRVDGTLNNPIENGSSRPVTEAGVLFTHLDEAHNRRALDRGVSSGRLPRDLYQSAILAMDSYGRIRHERLVTLVSGYIRNSTLKEAVKKMKREFHCRPESGTSLNRLLDLQRKSLHRWREGRRQSSESRRLLSESLDEILRNTEVQSGIFLIKPILSWAGGSNLLKSSSRINAYLKVVPKNITVSPHASAGQVSIR
ncbi:hypothetical protein NDU88_006359 [Pleurodeles waltl]|uniref:Uncharacterized protein n=1 Tax=Pleurodeles waltl TaxID=8319 RepID=A0AAV7TZA7_PLEWA|nr:hypothetical protein NDU88_006359 [Pleurodeles waltl]